MKKIFSLVLILVMVFSLCGCNSNDAELKARIAELETENAELKLAIATMVTPSSENTGTANKKTSPSPDSQVEVECPSVVISNGYHIKVKDAYVKCLNTNSSTYDYDGMFLFFRGEIISVDSNHEDWLVITFDCYDLDDRYAGDVMAVYESGLGDNSIGKTISGNALLCLYDASKAVYNGESETTSITADDSPEVSVSASPAAPTPKPTVKPSTSAASYSMSDFVEYVENRTYSDKNLKGNCKVESDDSSVTVWLSFDGLATELLTEMLSGQKSSHDSLQITIKALCLDLMNKAEEYKVDCNIMVALLNDANPENTMIAYIDGIKVSDYLD